ncbi:MAG: hypothetical protein AB8H80_13920 [Planctomycetota bacterium]
MFAYRKTCSALLMIAAAVVVQPGSSDLREFAGWLLRPARLPYAWQGRMAAAASGDSAEAFARGQQIVQLLPGWTGGHIAFVYRYVLQDDTARHAADDVAAAAERRLRAGLLWLDAARSDANSREFELVESAAFLPDIACRNFPGLADRLADLGGPTGIADRYLQEAERLSPTAEVREMRLWFLPKLAAALMEAGSRQQALQTLDLAVRRAREARDTELATEWAERVTEVARHWRGEPGVDLAAVRADPRFASLLHLLR